ncbi:venom metalloproteinase antarease TserMP_A-like [Dermacentor andersoni]|uniref:venom metalloproteinase antarease TserMP_A-like n=1 Tax=Dermacentor andersoni TaxID=34620 RepID=UPI002415B1B3|nr:venom metalloproteinase antarease TserMP_A-like [Dermacentor andersoni]
MAAALALRLPSLWRAATELHTYPRILQERTTAGNLVLKLNEEITLNLERSTVLADNLVFVTNSNGINEVETIQTSHIQETIYHDTHYQASVTVRQKDGNVEVEGIINDNLRIKPLPEGERSLQGQMLHKIYEVDVIKENFISAAPPKTEAPGSAVEKFAVELHIISDKEHQQSYKKNEELVSYLAVMANAVNLRYLDMDHPKINFLLVGITRARDHDFGKIDNGKIEGTEMLKNLQTYKDEGKIAGSYDVIYLMTGLDMYRLDKGKVETGASGYALVGQTCRKQGVGEGEDTALTYSGVKTLAHELAHSLGSPHDETPECPWSEGYLMSYVDGGLKKYKLSRCSQAKIREYVQKLPQDCIKVQSEKNYSSGQKKFPGQTIRKVYYCKKMLNQKAKGRKIIDKMNGSCKLKCCYRRERSMTCWEFPMLDGMECAPGKTCKRGICGEHAGLS